MPSIHFDITADNQDLLRKFSQIASSINSTTKTVEGAGASVDDMLNHMSVAMDSILNEMRRVNSGISGTTDKASRAFTNASDEIRIKYGEAMAQMRQQTTELGDTVQSAAGSIKNGFMQALGFAGVNLLQEGLTSLYQNIFNTRSYFEDINSSMEVFLGNTEKAAEFTQKLKDYAWFNAFEFSDLAQASQQLIAYRNDVEDVIPIIDKLSNVAVGTKGNLMELVGIYNRAKSTGIVDSEAMRVWATRGVVIKDILKDMGENAAVTSVSFDKLNEVLDYVTSEGQMFHDLQGNMMSNLSMSKGQLEDDITALYDDFGNAMMPTLKGLIEAGDQFVNVLDELIASAQPFLDVMNESFTIVNENFGEVAEQIKKPIETLFSAFSTDEDSGVVGDFVKALATNLATLVHVLQDAVVAYGAYKVAMATSVVIKKALLAIEEQEAVVRALMNAQVAKGAITQEVANAADTKAIAIKTLLTGSLKAYTTAALQASAATLTNPYVLAAAAFIALSVAIYEVVTADDAYTKAQKDMADEMEELNNATEERVKQAKNEKKTIENGTESVYARIKALQKLKEKYDSLKGYSLEDIATMSDTEFEKLIGNEEREKNLETLREELKYVQEIQKAQKDARQYGNVTITDSISEEAQAYYDRLRENKKFGEVTWGNEEYWKTIEEGVLNNIIELQEEADDRPIEIRIKEAEDNKENKEEIVNWYTRYENMVGEFEKQKEEYANSPIMSKKMMDDTDEDFSKFMNELDWRIAKLKEDAARDPMKFQAQLDDLTKFRNEMEEAKDTWDKDGLLTLTLNFRANLSNAQSLLEKAKNFLSGLGGGEKQEDNVVKNYDYYAKRKKSLEDEKKGLANTDANKAARDRIDSEIAEIDKALAWYNKDKKKNNRGGKKKNLAQERQAYKDAVEKQAKERIRAEKDAEFKAEQYLIDAMEESESKTLKQIRLNYKKEEDAIVRATEDILKKREEQAKALWDKDPVNKAAKAKGVIWETASNGRKAYVKQGNNTLTPNEQLELQNRAIANEKKYSSELKKIHEKRIEERVAYLKQFGTFAQQEQAINAEYDKKRQDAIDNGASTYELQSIEAGREQALSKNQLEQLKEDINWEEVFSNLDYVSTEHLERLRTQLRAALDMGDITAENARVITEKLNEIDKQIQQKRSVWGQLFGGANQGVGGVINAVRDQKALNADAEQKRRDAILASGMASALRLTADDLKKTKGEDSEEYLKAQRKADEADKDAQKKNQAAEIAEGLAGNGSLAITGAIIHGVNDNVQSFAEAAQLLGGKNSEFAKSAAKFAESSQFATDGFEKLKSGDFIGAALSVGKAVNSLGETFGLWSNSNVEDVQKENKRLAAAMALNTQAIERLTKKMGEGDTVNAAKNYEEAIAVMKQNEDLTKQVLLNTGRMYDGAHSTSHYFNEEKKGTLNAINRILGTNYGALGDVLEGDIATLNKLYETEAGRQALKSFTEAISWAESKAGMENNALAEQFTAMLSNFNADAYKEIDRAFQTAITGISFDSFKSNFKSALMDMQKDSKDFADDFTQQLTQSFLNAQIEDAFADRIEELYDEWGEAIKGNVLDESELRSLRSKQEDLVNEMIAKRNQIAAITGYDDVSTSEASGSINSAKSMSEDTANELIGRMTAVQIAVEGIRSQDNVIAQQVINGVTALMSITSVSASNNEVLNAILLQHVQSNSYLEDISKYNKAMYSEWGNQINAIRTKIDTL